MAAPKSSTGRSRRKTVARKKSQSEESANFACPIPATHQKYNESHYFISQMVSEYHHPFPFLCNVDALLQSLRAVTFMIQAELAHRDAFDEWYEEERATMRGDPLLRRFVEGRDIAVHRGMLSRRSRIQAGLFRGRMLKLAFQFDLDIDEPSEDILKRTQKVFIGSLLDKEHSAIGEQLGVQREWIVAELGDEEAISLCDKVWARIGKVVAAAHLLVGAKFEPPPEQCHDLTVAGLLLESDVDPSLLKKWRW